MGIEWILGVDMLSLKDRSQTAFTRNDISHIHSCKKERYARNVHIMTRGTFTF